MTLLYPLMNMARPRLVLLGAHRWRRQPVVQMAQESGFDPVLLLYESETLPDSFFSAVVPNHILRQSTSRPRTPKDVAETIARMGGDWFALGLDDYVCQFAAELSSYGTKRTMKASAAHETLNKHLLRIRWNQLCTNNSRLYPVPFRFRRYADMTFTTIVEECEDTEFSEFTSLIVKPDALDASIGIHKVESWASVQPAIADVFAELAPLSLDVRSMGISIVPAIIAEHQIPRSKVLHTGAEFSAEFLSAKGNDSEPSSHLLIGITQKYVNPETFVEVAHCFPSPTFPDGLRETLEQVTAQLLDELGVECCISHWEYIVTEGGKLALVEAQLRPAGDWIMSLVAIATDSNPYHILFDALRSKDTCRVGFSNKRFASVFFPLPDREIHGAFSLECRGEAAALLGRRLFIADEVSNARAWGKKAEWHSRYLAVITEGQSFDEAKIKCHEILAHIIVAPLESSQSAGQIRLTLGL
jgi:hypothetical protein